MYFSFQDSFLFAVLLFHASLLVCGVNFSFHFPPSESVPFYLMKDIETESDVSKYNFVILYWNSEWQVIKLEFCNSTHYS